MVDKLVEIGTISARGQIAIPAQVRRRLSLLDGEKVIFAVEGDALIVKKFDKVKTWEEVTRPLRASVSNSSLKESDILDLVHKARKLKKDESNSRH